MVPIHACENPGDEAWDREGYTVVVAECCRVAFIAEDCSVFPPGFEFVCIGDPEWRLHVTCPDCLDRRFIAAEERASLVYGE